MNCKILEIDYTDWHDEVMNAEEMVATQDDVFALIDKGRQTSQIAKSAIVSREVGVTKEDIIKPNKMLLMTGAMLNVSSIVKSRKQDVMTESGKTYQINEYIGKVGKRNGKPKKQDDSKAEEEQYPDNYQQSISDDGLRLAMRYLVRVIPGHIWNHLLIVYQNDGDYKQAAEQLKASIDAMVDRLE